MQSKGKKAVSRAKCTEPGCNSIAARDRWCKQHRPGHLRDKIEAEANPKINRDSFKGFGDNFGKKGFFSDTFGIIKDNFDVENTF